MPMSEPLGPSTGPPALPGLNVASICRHSSRVVPPRVMRLTTPRVVESSSPPMAKPTAMTSVMMPGSAVGSGSAGIASQNEGSSTVSTAMSTSKPTCTTLATNFCASTARRTCTRVQFSTTCACVKSRRSPDGRIAAKPEPTRCDSSPRIHGSM